MNECVHCGERAVIWDSAFSFEGYGMEAEGIVHVYHCAHSGACIEYYIDCEEENEDE